jgi:heme A synthase
MPANAISPVAARWIRAWLILLGLMVYATVLVGGATRLTDSGLSITEWQPVKGALPPLNDAAWLAEFDKYRETTQYSIDRATQALQARDYKTARRFASSVVRADPKRIESWKLLGAAQIGLQDWSGARRSRRSFIGFSRGNDNP